MPKDYYAILEVDRSASRDQIRARFLALARKRHPDLFRGPDKARAEEVFQGITEAFNILYNPERRRLHDLELSQPKLESRPADISQLMRIYMSRGIKAMREKKLVEAAENFDRATKTDDKNAQAWFFLASVCSQNPRWRSRSLTAAAQACELDKMNAEYHKLAGQLCVQSNMPIRAERYFRLALQWGGPDPEIEQALAELKKSK